MKVVPLLLPLVLLAACSGTEAPACRGEVFQLNPTRMAPAATVSGRSGAALAPSPAAAPVAGVSAGGAR